MLAHNLYLDIESAILPSDFWMKCLYDCAADSIGLWYSSYFTSFCNDVSSRSPHTYVHISVRLALVNSIVEILKIWARIRLYSNLLLTSACISYRCMKSVQKITLYLHAPEHFSCSIIMWSPHASRIYRVTLLLSLCDCVFISTGLICVLMLYFNNFFYLLLSICALEVAYIVTNFLYYIIQTKREVIHITTLLIARFV